MGLFGWSYPPGCNGPPEEPDPPAEAEEVWEILEKSGIAEDVIEQVVEIVTNLCCKADQECLACLDRYAKEELQAEKDMEKYWDEMEKRK